MGRHHIAVCSGRRVATCIYSGATAARCPNALPKHGGAAPLKGSEAMSSFVSCSSDGKIHAKQRPAEEACGKPTPFWHRFRAVHPVESVADPEEPVADPEQPVADPEEPVADPEEPVADPEEPVADPQEPVADPEEPVADPEEPVADPEEPVAYPGQEEPVADAKEPMADPEEPVGDAEGARGRSGGARGRSRAAGPRLPALAPALFARRRLPAANPQGVRQMGPTAGRHKLGRTEPLMHGHSLARVLQV
eukprot:gene11993-biopygen4307